MDELITIKGLSKSYGGVQALSGLDLNIAVGEVHALCGENGAGKSTLNKILSGSISPDQGSITFLGSPFPYGNVAKAERRGVGIVHQEPTLFPDLNAVDNIFLGHELRSGIALDSGKMNEQARALFTDLGESIDIHMPVADLSFAQRQMVAIARAISHQCKLLILDEPTSALSTKETETLYRLVRGLRGSGVSVLYVTHRLQEVFDLADRVTVLRDGKLVSTSAVSQQSQETLVTAMVGRQVASSHRIRESSVSKSAPFLKLTGLSRTGEFSNISFSVCPGEVVGLGGLVGAGRSEISKAIFGLTASTGVIELDGKQISPKSPEQAIRYGIALVPEDRGKEGLVLPMSVGNNLTLSTLSEISVAGFIQSTSDRARASAKVSELSIKTDSIGAAVSSLSGGNQQKVLFGKWLATGPKLLILDEPTRGVDVGAKAEMHRLVLDLCRKGHAILLISSDLPELIDLSDRVVVLRQGSISGELQSEQITPEAVLALALPDSTENRREETKERRRISQELALSLLTILLMVIVGFSNRSFLALGNLKDILVHVAPIAIAGCGMTLVIVAKEIDISVGSTMGLVAASLGIITATDRMGLPVWLGVLVGLAVGCSVGLLNGLLIAIGRVPSIIVTLGMLTIIRGLTESLMHGEWIKGLPPGLREWGVGSIAGIPISIWIAIASVALTIWIARRTALGRRIYALGSNPTAFPLTGASAGRTKLFVFTFCGLMVALATLISVPQLSVIESGIGNGFELVVITCVLVGGTSILGGRGNVVGSVVGSLLLGTISTMLIFLKLGESASYWERAIQGSMILAAVGFDWASRRKISR